MKNIKQFISESKESLNALFDFNHLIGKKSISVSSYDLNDNQLLENIAGPFIEYAIVQDFKTKDHGDWFSKLFSNVTWNKNSNLWDFSAILDEDLFNASDIEDLPFGQKLNFEVKAFKGDPHNITLTKPQFNALETDNVYFILVDYTVGNGKYNIENMYLTDGKTMKSVMGAKSVKSSAFKKIIVGENK